MDSSLNRVKAMIWGHSLLGAGLLFAYVAVIGKDIRLFPCVLGCWLIWIVALRPLARQAAKLTAAARASAGGLPRWFLGVCAVAQLGGLAAGWGSHEGGLALGYLLAGITLIVRESISAFLEVPMHRKTWATCLLLVGFGLLRHTLGYILQAAMGT
jgi:hypothetical protein